MALCKTCKIWELKTSLSSSGNVGIPSSTPATISTVGIFLGAKAKFVPLWSTDILALLSGLLEMFSAHLSQLIVSFGNDLFDFEVGA